MRKIVHIALLLAAVESLSRPAYAQEKVYVGRPLEVFADPNDVVVLLDKKGDCGSNFFHIRRTNVNFKELSAIALTAISTSKQLRFFVPCQGQNCVPTPNSCFLDRNIVDHGSVFND